MDAPALRIMGNSMGRCCSGKATPPRLGKAPLGEHGKTNLYTDPDTGIDVPSPALPLLQRDLRRTQAWLDNSKQAAQKLHQLRTNERASIGAQECVNQSNRDLVQPSDEGRKKIEVTSVEGRVEHDQIEENRDVKRRFPVVSQENTSRRVEALVDQLLFKTTEVEHILFQCHSWLNSNNYEETTFDLEVTRLQFAWSEYCEQLAELARFYQLPHLTSKLKASNSSIFKTYTKSANRSPDSSNQGDPDTEAANHDPGERDPQRKKRRFVPHLTWQYRAVIKSQVKYRTRSRFGSAASSDAGSVFSETQNLPSSVICRPAPRRPLSGSTRSLTLPSTKHLLTPGPESLSCHAAALTYSRSTDELPTDRIADRPTHPIDKPDVSHSTRLLRGYRPPASPSALGRPRAELSPAYLPEDLQGTVILDPHTNALILSDRNRKPIRRRAIQTGSEGRTSKETISIVRCSSADSGDIDEISVPLRSKNSGFKERSKTDVNMNVEGADNYKLTKIPPLKETLGGMLTRSTGIHEDLSSFQQPGTPMKASHKVTVVTPGAEFKPPDVSTPFPSLVRAPQMKPDAAQSRQPQTPVEIRRFLGTNNSALGRSSPGVELTADFSDNSSNVSSIIHSPTDQSHRTARKELKKQYKKDELWQAIRQDYHYLMDDDIIEQCKSTDSDLSWDDEHAETAVSFTDFIKQYNELMEWLNQIQMFTQRQGSSLSEKYLNQSYYEEMLERSPRRKLFNDYAKRLMRRFPNMKDEITVRVQHLNNQWQSLQRSVAPREGLCDRDTMLRDLALDLQGLERWVNLIEKTLLPMTLNPDLSYQQLKDMLVKHQALQQDIECHSKVVSAILKLCERLHREDNFSSTSEELQLTALNLERRWHAIWLQSLEWQCRLEDGIAARERLLSRSFHPDHSPDDLTGDLSLFDQSQTKNLEPSQSEASILEEAQSEISQGSNARTVTHDRSTSPATSTLRRKSNTRISTNASDGLVQSVDPGDYYLKADDNPEILLELPDSLAVDVTDLSADTEYTAVRPKQGLVRHLSERGPSVPFDTDLPFIPRVRKRRYSDSAHNTLDSSPNSNSPNRGILNTSYQGGDNFKYQAGKGSTAPQGARCQTLRNNIVTSRSLTELDRLEADVLRGSYTVKVSDLSDPGSHDSLSDGRRSSDFDETENLLQSVANKLRREDHWETSNLHRTFSDEPRVYDPLADTQPDSDDEFFMYDDSSLLSHSHPARLHLTGGEDTLGSLIEEEEMSSASSSPRRRLYSPGEKVFPSPKVKQFLHLESFSNTVSPATTPPRTRSEAHESEKRGVPLVSQSYSSLGAERRSLFSDSQSSAHIEDNVFEGNAGLSPEGELVILDNERLSRDMGSLPSDVLNEIASSLSPGSPGISTGGTTRDKLVYSLDEYNSRLSIKLSPQLQQQDGIPVLQASGYDDYYDSTDSSDLGSGECNSKYRVSAGLLKSTRYSAIEDLSALAALSGNESDDIEDLVSANQDPGLTDSRRSLSPTDLPSGRGFSSYDYMIGHSRLVPSQQKGSTDFGYVSGGTTSERMDISPRSTITPESRKQSHSPTNPPISQTTHRSLVSTSTNHTLDLTLQPTNQSTSNTLEPSYIKHKSSISVIIENDDPTPISPTNLPVKQTLCVVSVRSSCTTSPGESDVESEPNENVKQSQTSHETTIRKPTTKTVSVTNRKSNGPSKITVSGSQPTSAWSGQVQRAFLEQTAEMRTVKVENVSVNVDVPGVVSQSSFSPKHIKLERTVVTQGSNPAELISRSGFRLQENQRSQKVEDKSSRDKPVTGSFEFSIVPPMDRRTVKVITNRSQAEAAGTDRERATPKATSFNPNVSHLEVGDTGKFSVLKGQTSNLSHLAHDHGSCDDKIHNVACWEKNPGFPANWEILVRDSNSEAMVEADVEVTEDDWLDGRRRRSSSDTSVSTGKLTPSRRYLKISTASESDAAEFTETILINKNSSLLSTSEFNPTPTPTGNVDTSTSLTGNVNTPTVHTGTCEVKFTLNIPKLSVLALRALPETTTITTLQLETLSQRRGTVVLGSGKSQFQSNEYTHIHLERHKTEENLIEAPTPQATHDKYTVEASLNFKAPESLPYKNFATHSSISMGSNPDPSQRTVFTKRVRVPENTGSLNTPLVMTATSTQVGSSEDDITELSGAEVTKRQIVYRITDSGEVVFGDDDTPQTSDLSDTQDPQTIKTANEYTPITLSTNEDDPSDLAANQQRALDDLDSLLEEHDNSDSDPETDQDQPFTQLTEGDLHKLATNQRRILAELEDSPVASQDATLSDLITGTNPPEETNLNSSPTPLPGTLERDLDADSPIKEDDGQSYESGLTDDEESTEEFENSFKPLNLSNETGSDYDTDELLQSKEPVDLNSPSLTDTRETTPSTTGVNQPIRQNAQVETEQPVQYAEAIIPTISLNATSSALYEEEIRGLAQSSQTEPVESCDTIHHVDIKAPVPTDSAELDHSQIEASNMVQTYHSTALASIPEELINPDNERLVLKPCTSGIHSTGADINSPSVHSSSHTETQIESLSMKSWEESAEPVEQPDMENPTVDEIPESGLESVAESAEEDIRSSVTKIPMVECHAPVITAAIQSELTTPETVGQIETMSSHEESDYDNMSETCEQLDSEYIPSARVPLIVVDSPSDASEGSDSIPIESTSPFPAPRAESPLSAENTTAPLNESAQIEDSLPLEGQAVGFNPVEQTNIEAVRETIESQAALHHENVPVELITSFEAQAVQGSMFSLTNEPKKYQAVEGSQLVPLELAEEHPSIEADILASEPTKEMMPVATAEGTLQLPIERESDVPAVQSEILAEKSETSTDHDDTLLDVSSSEPKPTQAEAREESIQERATQDILSIAESRPIRSSSEPPLVECAISEGETIEFDPVEQTNLEAVGKTIESQAALHHENVPVELITSFEAQAVQGSMFSLTNEPKTYQAVEGSQLVPLERAEKHPSREDDFLASEPTKEMMLVATAEDNLRLPIERESDVPAVQSEMLAEGSETSADHDDTLLDVSSSEPKPTQAEAIEEIIQERATQDILSIAESRPIRSSSEPPIVECGISEGETLPLEGETIEFNPVEQTNLEAVGETIESQAALHYENVPVEPTTSFEAQTVQGSMFSLTKEPKKYQAVEGSQLMPLEHAKEHPSIEDDIMASEPTKEMMPVATAEGELWLPIERECDIPAIQSEMLVEGSAMSLQTSANHDDAQLNAFPSEKKPTQAETSEESIQESTTQDVLSLDESQPIWSSTEPPNVECAISEEIQPTVLSGTIDPTNSQLATTSFQHEPLSEASTRSGEEFLLQLGTPTQLEPESEAAALLENLELGGSEAHRRLEKRVSVLSDGTQADGESDGACDGDESSEGDIEDLKPDSGERKDFTAPAERLSHLTDPLALSPVNDSTSSDTRSLRESSIETVKHRHLPSDRGSSPDRVVGSKPTPTKRRRRRRPKSLVGGAPEAKQDPGIALTPPTAIQLTTSVSGSESHDPSTANQYTVSESEGTDTAAFTSDGPKWDYYQAYYSPSKQQEPLYGGSGEIDEEAELDDSVLQWDDELDDSGGATILSDPSTYGLSATGDSGEGEQESEDSDVEDLHDVIEQSYAQLRKADSALRKARRDVAHCGIYLDPQKYSEWHATCQTNIMWLKTISETLDDVDNETGITNLTDEDLQQVHDLIDQWQQLEQLSSQRRDQSQTLSKLYRDLCSIKKTLTLCENQQAEKEFNDVAELESHYKTLQTLRVTAQSQPYRLQQISDALLLFENENPKIKMANFKRMVEELRTTIRPIVLGVSRASSDLHSAITDWNSWEGVCSGLEREVTPSRDDLEIPDVQITLLSNKCDELERDFSSFQNVLTEEARDEASRRIQAIRDRINSIRSSKSEPDRPTAAIAHKSVEPNEEPPVQAKLPHSNIEEPVITGASSELTINTDSGIGATEPDYASPDSKPAESDDVTDKQAKDSPDQSKSVCGKSDEPDRPIKILTKEAIKSNKRDRKTRKGKRKIHHNKDPANQNEPSAEPDSSLVESTPEQPVLVSLESRKTNQEIPAGVQIYTTDEPTASKPIAGIDGSTKNPLSIHHQSQTGVGETAAFGTDTPDQTDVYNLNNSNAVETESVDQVTPPSSNSRKRGPKGRKKRGASPNVQKGSSEGLISSEPAEQTTPGLIPDMDTPTDEPQHEDRSVKEAETSGKIPPLKLEEFIEEEGAKTPAVANPDVVTPDVATPDIATPDVATPDVAIPDVAIPDVATPDIATPEVATPDVATPDIVTPDVATPDIATPENATPDVAIPDVAIPDIATPDIATPEVATPDVVTPDVATPDIATPDNATPDVVTPDIVTSDIATPDVVTPDVVTPDVATPDVAIPDVATPDVATPDIVTPDVATPDVATSDVATPDVATPDLVDTLVRERRKAEREVKTQAADVQNDEIAAVKHSCSLRRTLSRTAPAIILGLLILFVLLFLLQPRCCENSQYHRGIFGVRKRHDHLPPH